MRIAVGVGSCSCGIMRPCAKMHSLDVFYGYYAPFLGNRL